MILSLKSADEDMLHESIWCMNTFFFFKLSGKSLFTYLPPFSTRLPYCYHDNGTFNQTKMNHRVQTINTQCFVTVHSQTNTQCFFEFNYHACSNFSRQPQASTATAFRLCSPKGVKSISITQPNLEVFSTVLKLQSQSRWQFQSGTWQ